MLVDLLGGDEVAPVYVIRLWAHCQQRRTSVFDSLPTAALRAICRYVGDAQAFENALLDAGFISRIDSKLTVTGWDEYNASLLANWANGAKGGRPKKADPEPTDNPPETHGLPMGKPSQTHGKPTANPRETHREPIREDKTREESKTLTNTDVLVVASNADDQLAADSPARPKDALPDCPHQKLIGLYAERLAELPQPRIWEGERQKSMRARWRWVLTAKKPDGTRYATDEQSALDYFSRFFWYVSESDFLTGRNGKWTGCDLAWLMKSENFNKVIQGNYQNKSAA
ncbi:hypothetical protein AWB79_01271 [Caballeronia hypogeia]|uniref:Uncharacterized protein n=1 Tax=Caballeronia hypogeia TaxID=1777140 RepID=A0A157ZRZ8_9BURK|nr:hypothetical protein [Caballeronia hypogeia]SAK48265.1 hypothetical protein AWB79_01271 [Caballeronia hypogeia]